MLIHPQGCIIQGKGFIEMLKLILALLLLLYPGVLAHAAPAAQQTLEGNWVGSFQFEGHLNPLNGRFERQEGGIKGTLDLPPSQRDLTVIKLTTEGNRIRFELPEAADRLIFEGQIRDGLISGTVLQAGKRGTFQLVRTAKVDPGIYPGYAGIYRLDANRFIHIQPFMEFDGLLTYIDDKTGRIGALYPQSETTFFSGPAALIPAPIDVRIKFVKNKSQVTGLVWYQGVLPGKKALKINFKADQVQFRSGDVTVAGTLITPVTKGPHPAVVALHGSGPLTREGQILLFGFLVPRGIALLAYDKRGTGQSQGGDWRDGFDDLAGDAVAAVQLLKTRKEINPKQIGLLGISEGGWVAPLAASRSSDVAFAILDVAPALTIEEINALKVKCFLRADKFPEKQISEAVAFQKYKDQAFRSGSDWEKYEVALKEARTKPWYSRFTGGPPARNEDYLKILRTRMDYHPARTLESLKIPVLAIYGESDCFVPPNENRAAMEQALSKGGNKDYTIVLLPKANHLSIEAQTGSWKEALQMKRFVPGYFDTIINWIRKRVSSTK